MIDLANIPSERQVLGAAMQWPDCIDDINLVPEDFANAAHASIWRSIKGIADHGDVVDPVIVAQAMERDGSLDGAGGLVYLAELAMEVYSAGNVGMHAKAVRDKSVRRSLMAALRQIGEAVDTQDMGDVLALAQERIMAIGQRAETRAPARVADIALERVQVLEERYVGNDDGQSTGLTDLDEKLGKIRGGDLLVVAGRPGMGKSAFAMQLARTMASADKPALFFSLEMSAGQLVDRLLSSEGRVNLKKFRSATFQDDDWAGLTAAVGQVRGLDVYIDDHSASLGQILSTMRAFKRRHGLGVVVIDYIGLVESQGETREQEVARITRALKLAAKQLGCPVLALSQLNRKLEDRGDRRPQQSDLRESGAVEQDADAILMLYRDEVYNPDSEHKGICEVLIRKNRHGETGMVPVVFRADVVRFENFAGHYEPRSNTARTRKRDSV